MSSVTHSESGALTPGPQADATLQNGVAIREQLANGGESGPENRVSIPVAMITKLRGIMEDFDPDLYDREKLPPGATESPLKLFETFVGPMLDRHPLFAKAEVRDSGRGLHALLWFDPPVEFRTEGERTRWAAAVKAVQRTLPADRHAPGITAMTRPVGSINNKTGRAVSILKKGTPVSPDEVLKFVAELQAKPFKVVADIVLGPNTSPCPICRKPNTRLGVLERHGMCYGGCGKPTLGRVFDTFYAATSTAKEV